MDQSPTLCHLPCADTDPHRWKVFKTFDRLNKVVQENLRGIRVVKSYVRDEYEVEKFKGVSKDIYGYFSHAEKLLAFVSPLMQFIVYAAILLVSWFGAQFIVAGTLTTGELNWSVCLPTQCRS